MAMSLVAPNSPSEQPLGAGASASDARASVHRWYAAAAAKLDAIEDGSDRDSSAHHEEQEGQAADLIGSEEGGLDALAAKLHLSVRCLLIASSGMHGTAVTAALRLTVAALLDARRLQLGTKCGR